MRGRAWRQRSAAAAEGHGLAAASAGPVPAGTADALADFETDVDDLRSRINGARAEAAWAARTAPP